MHGKHLIGEIICVCCWVIPCGNQCTKLSMWRVYRWDRRRPDPSFPSHISDATKWLRDVRSVFGQDGYIQNPEIKRGRGAARGLPEQVAKPSRCCREAAKQIMSCLDYLREPDYSRASSSGSAPSRFCRDQLFSLSSCCPQLSLTCS